MTQGVSRTPRGIEIELRPAVLAMAVAMESRLREFDDERGRRGWHERNPGGDPSEQAHVHLPDSIAKLQDALQDGYEASIVKRAADVANHAMIAADLSGALDEAYEILSVDPEKDEVVPA